ncbi:hypothetical protein PLICRDRAFT_43203 [Plicaturopsis crispa FD-325 SS-3]|nr:hypothetical protein PLICRDRAFT_43203 [Plicaturopsis crispa FD-325 SS-3]
MTDALSPPRPAWQTDELDEEWVEPDSDDGQRDDDITASSHGGTRSISFTEPLPVDIRRSESPSISPTTPDGGGTFLVRQDIPAAPFLPKTPGNNKKGLIKDFFSPLALERMFEPPSPPNNKPVFLPPGQTNAPAVPSRLAREYIPGQTDDEDEDQHTPEQNLERPFTFSVTPQGSALTPNAFPQAQSTPGVPAHPKSSTNPNTPNPALRLFQFQYDTFTRDHLSAIVDSIAVNNSSGTPTPGAGLSPVSEANSTPSRFRSAKRVKLSPASDFYGEGEGEGAVIARPRVPETKQDVQEAPVGQGRPVLRRDYVGESKLFMQKIKQARDFSTISTMSSAHKSVAASRVGEEEEEDSFSQKAQSGRTPEPQPDRLEAPNHGSAPSSDDGSNNGKRSTYSSLAYRQKAADLMAAIKSDMKGSKRLFSDATDASLTTQTEHKSILSEDFSARSDRKENHRITSHSRHPSSSLKQTSPRAPRNVRSPHSPGRTHRARQRPSPRKGMRRVSSDIDIAADLSHMSIEEPWQAVPPRITTIPPTPNPQSNSPNPPPSTAPAATAASPNHTGVHPPTGPSYPSTSIRSRGGPNEDLNRFVSSSTASGTTLTAGSAPSFVKHGQSGAAQITRIAPEDVPTLPHRVGKMVFDTVMMKWVKATAAATGVGYMKDFDDDGEEDRTRASDASEDPFRDFESLREDDTGVIEPMSVIEEATERSRSHTDDVRVEDAEEEDEEEMEMFSFSLDGPSGGVVHVMTGEEDEDDATTDSIDEEDELERTITSATEDPLQYQEDAFDSEDEIESVQATQANPEHRSPRREPTVPLMSFTTPHRPSAGSTPAPRSVLKSASATPVSSALKDTSLAKYHTPAPHKRHRRSVSFSDGKRDGPIVGIGRNGEDGSQMVEDAPGATPYVPSARSKRIADMMAGLQDDTGYEDDESPSKTTSSGRPEELQPLTSRRPSEMPRGHTSPRRVFSRAQTHRSPANSSRGGANATFLTECSFGVAHDRLVEVITDVQPYEPHWEDLTTIDLCAKNLESVARLKEFLPKLDSLNLNSNQLSWMSGIPTTVRTLSVASNTLTGITSFSHLLNLENLDISRNDIDSLRQLECLRHLRELRADHNHITSIDGLQKMDGLVKLSLQGNSLRDIDVTEFRWSRLEMLDVSHNRLDRVAGLASLAALIAFNADDNTLGELEPGGQMPRLRILRVSGNRLRQLHAGLFPNLRTLYADNNSLSGLVKAERLTKLENLSLRNQSGRGLNLSTRHVRDVKRLYLSGNPLKAGFLPEPCYNLVYLELAACRLTSLPPDLVRLAPNLRVLNLNYNFLEDARPLEGLTRLRKLTLIGSRLTGTKPLIRLLQRMPDVEMLDFRMNPCTLGWYLPLLVKDVPGALQPSEGAATAASGRGERPADRAWQELDSKFRRDLPDEAYIGRLAYRGLAMRACPRMRMLDGVEVSEKERAKANHLLHGILSKENTKKVVSGEPRAVAAAR